MSHNTAPRTKLTTVALSPRGYFLENLALREAGSMLVTVLNHRELWYMPPVSAAALPIEPVRLYKFLEPTTASSSSNRTSSTSQH